MGDSDGKDHDPKVIPLFRPVPPNWMRNAHRNAKGKIIGNVENTLLALRECPQLHWCFAYDQMAHLPLVMGGLPLLPGQDRPEGETWPRLQTDADEVHLQAWLQHEAMPHVALGTVRDAIGLRCQERRFHPVRKYLDSLEWDGEMRLAHLMTGYFGAEHSSYAIKIGIMFMIALIARVRQPGCQMDYMVVLEGEQGMLKSSALKILGGPWFSDTLPDIRQARETSQHLRGKWIIEIGELAAISHAQSERLKAFLTHRTERYLPRYARNEVEEPRQCVFVGSTNRDTYLSDESGGRRFWPIKTGDILLKALEEDRDQLFAEACVRYDAGNPWWPDPAWEARHIKPEQEARFETDPWEDAVLAHVNAKMPDSDGVVRVQISESARVALGADATFRVATKDQRRIAAILIRHGWRPGRENVKRFYFKYLGESDAGASLNP